MRYFLLTKWIQEINIEINKAKDEQNLYKVSELHWLKADLVGLRDEVS